MYLRESVRSKGSFPFGPWRPHGTLVTFDQELHHFKAGNSYPKYTRKVPSNQVPSKFPLGTMWSIDTRTWSWVLNFPTKLDFTMLSISKGTLFGKVRSFLEDSTQDRTGHRTGGNLVKKSTWRQLFRGTFLFFLGVNNKGRRFKTQYVIEALAFHLKKWQIKCANVCRVRKEGPQNSKRLPK